MRFVLVLSYLAAALAILSVVPTRASGAEILACVDSKSGAVRVVGSPLECDAAKESLLAWNAEGAEGPEGPAGLQGPQGVAAPEFRFVGLGNPTLGSAGIDDLNAACDAAHTGSRMCSSLEILKSPVIQTFSASVWLRPDIVGVDGAGNAVDASGLTFPSARLTCDGWKNGSGFSGLALIPNGGFNILACDATRNVACCGPVSD